MRSSYSEQDEKPEFWFNLQTKQVEVGKQSAASHRMGPFATREEAQAALAKAAERAAKWLEDEAKD